MKMILVIFICLNFLTRSQAEIRRIDLGGITLEISDSWTAQVFHVVDQLSMWSPYSHRQYIRWAKKNMNLNKDDGDMLQQHAALRKAHQNSDDFDESFLVEGTIDEAASVAVIAKKLSADEAKREKAILNYFSARLSMLREQGSNQAAHFFQRLNERKSETVSLVAKLCHFAETKGKVNVPVFLVVNPEEGSGGGEANGGRLVIETQSDPDPISFVIHESLHFLLKPYNDKMQRMCDSAKVEFEVINEGIAYGMEGLVEDVDVLPNALVRNIAIGKTVADRYTQFYMAAILFRPLLRSALEKGETFTAILPTVINTWKQIASHS